MSRSPVTLTSGRQNSTLEDHLRHLCQAPSGSQRPALVVQGGGLRGIYSMAALAVLEELGLRDAFSVVIGSSAGALNGAYFLAGQARQGLSIYLDELSTGRFVAPWRIWRVVDVDYLIDTVLKQRHPLDQEALRAANAPLHTVLTDAETAMAKIVSSEDEQLDTYEILRATAALPCLYNKRVRIGDRDYVDGGVASLIPLGEAFSTGTNEAVILLTRGAGHRLKNRGLVYRTAVRLLSPGHSPPVYTRICNLHSTYNGEMEWLEQEHEIEPRITWTLRPSDLDRLVSQTTNNIRRLRECAQMGRADMLQLLQQSRPVTPDAVQNSAYDLNLVDATSV